MGPDMGRRQTMTEPTGADASDRVGEAAGSHWFEAIADHLGPAYLRYSFTKGTVREVDEVVALLALEPGMRVLDVGCGPGRHAHELARRGIAVHGVDVSRTFIDLAHRGAPPGATFGVMDARAMTFDAEFDAAICLCQGAFGLMRANGDDERVLAGIARSLRPGGGLVLSAFNAYFAVKYHLEAEFDADSGVARETTTVRDADGAGAEFPMWTGCYTPRELRLLCAGAGMEVRSITSVEPGDYRGAPPTVESPEYLVVAFLTPSRREGAP